MLHSSGYIWHLVGCYLCDILAQTMICWMLTDISEGNLQYLTIFVILKSGYPLVHEIIYGLIALNCKKIIELKFKEQGYAKYDNLSFESKNKTSPNDFQRKMDDAISAMITIIDWGIPQLLGMISAIISCIFIFIKEKLYLLGIIIVSINSIAYFSIIRNLQKDFFEGRQKRKKEENKICNIKSLYLPLFQYKEKTVKDMLALDEKIVDGTLMNNKQWKKISLTTIFTNNIPILLLGLLYNISTIKLLLMLSCLQQFRDAVSGMMNFLNWFSRIEMDYNNYQIFWDELDFSEDPIKKELPDVVSIKNVDIKQSNFNVKFHHNTTEIMIKRGERILVRGKSGHGKTTLINAIMGKIKGIKLSSDEIENYYHHFVEFYQTIKEKMPSSSITIRQLFNDEKDDNIIIHCCKLCQIYDFVTNLSLRGKTTNDEIIDIEFMNVLDIDIQERISGGQKSRLALATRIYRLLKENKKILVLDEPEQGSDPEIAYCILNNIVELCQEKNAILIVISHLELIESSVQWHKILRINEGIVCVS